jgi:hypothetical protein
MAPIARLALADRLAMAPGASTVRIRVSTSRGKGIMFGASLHQRILVVRETKEKRERALSMLALHALGSRAGQSSPDCP